MLFKESSQSKKKPDIACHILQWNRSGYYYSTVTGRRDRLYAGRSNEERELTADLLKNENNDGLHILVDHQPREMGEMQKQDMI